MSQNEITEEELGAFIVALNEFTRKESTACLNCGQEVKQLIKRGRCVYAMPCGCRLWQGKIPEEWAHK